MVLCRQGSFGYGSRNADGSRILEFADGLNLSHLQHDLTCSIILEMRDRARCATLFSLSPHNSLPSCKISRLVGFCPGFT